MTIEPQSERTSSVWVGRVVVILIVAFIGVVIFMMFLAARGPGQ